jgi:hypothetical protein
MVEEVDEMRREKKIGDGGVNRKIYIAFRPYIDRREVCLKVFKDEKMTSQK